MLEGWQRDLLEAARVARLATISPDGRPHLVPVCYALVGGEIVIAVDEKPKRPGTLARIRNILRDPRASLLVDHYADDWDQLVWVRIDARARVLPAGSERPEALAALRTRYLQYREMALEGLPLIVLTPERVVAWRSREP
jgi:PPOX class probable F420-dependent enzyme